LLFCSALSQPVRLCIGLPFGTLDQILSCSSFSSDNYFILRWKAPSLTRKLVCSLQCNHSLVRSLTPNRTLPPHLRLCSLFVASYDSQGLRWKYSNPPPHGVTTSCITAPSCNVRADPTEIVVCFSTRLVLLPLVVMLGWTQQKSQFVSLVVTSLVRFPRVIWDVAPCGSCKARCFRGTCLLHL
jgi:hypothetical protein